MTTSFFVQKGGTGKSTLCAATAAYLASREGDRPVIIDIDPQASLTLISGADTSGPNILDVLQGRATAAEAVQAAGGWGIIPGSRYLASAEFPVEKLHTAIRTIKAPVLIDCPPGLSPLTMQALVISNSVVIPLMPDILSMSALADCMGTIRAAEQVAGTGKRIYTVIGRYVSRTTLAGEMAEAIDEQARAAGAIPIKTRIREASAVREAQALQKDIFSYRQNTPVAEDFRQAIAAFMGLEG